mmetsp:Transcript_19068/g.47371  ORF Transcript_19068/g.47371 Transcript_19068/m.47371 type:complete len:253 (-) Transcript_19068:114-872(-)
MLGKIGRIVIGGRGVVVSQASIASHHSAAVAVVIAVATAAPSRAGCAGRNSIVRDIVRDLGAGKRGCRIHRLVSFFLCRSFFSFRLSTLSLQSFGLVSDSFVAVCSGMVLRIVALVITSIDGRVWSHRSCRSCAIAIEGRGFLSLRLQGSFLSLHLVWFQRFVRSSVNALLLDTMHRNGGPIERRIRAIHFFNGFDLWQVFLVPRFLVKPAKDRGFWHWNRHDLLSNSTGRLFWCKCHTSFFCWHSPKGDGF